jgi:hypothetical protein
MYVEETYVCVRITRSVFVMMRMMMLMRMMMMRMMMRMRMITTPWN